MLRPLTIILPLLLVSCGGLSYFTQPEESSRDRKVASLALERLISTEEASFEEDIDERLLSLHRYYVLTQRNLLKLEQNLASLQRSVSADPAYHSLLALRTQVEELEMDLIDAYQSTQGKQGTSRSLVLEKIRSFSQRGQIEALSVHNLAKRLGYSLSVAEFDAGEVEIDAAYRQLVKAPEFQIFEKNIDHLSHVLEVGPRNRAPASMSQRVLWPAKVWALAFSVRGKEHLPQKITAYLKRFEISASIYRSSGESLPLALTQAKETGLSGISNIDALDWAPQTADRIIKRTKLMLQRAQRDAGVIYFHETYGRSSTAATVIMEELSRSAGRICALEKIVNDINQGQIKICSKD